MTYQKPTPQPNLSQFIETVEKNNNVEVEYGWYDWFCKDASLPLRTKKLLPALKLLKSKLGAKAELYFPSLKNNCPVYGKLYDSIMLVPEKNQELPGIYLVPRYGYDNDNSALLAIDVDGNAKFNKEYKAPTYKELKKIILDLDFFNLQE